MTTTQHTPIGRDAPSKLTTFGQQHKDLLTACESLMKLIEDGVLVRNIENDGDPAWVLTGVRLVKTLQEAQAAIARTKVGE